MKKESAFCNGESTGLGVNSDLSPCSAFFLTSLSQISSHLQRDNNHPVGGVLRSYINSARTMPNTQQ